MIEINYEKIPSIVQNNSCTGMSLRSCLPPDYGPDEGFIASPIEYMFPEVR